MVPQSQKDWQINAVYKQVQKLKIGDVTFEKSVKFAHSWLQELFLQNHCS